MKKSEAQRTLILKTARELFAQKRVQRDYNPAN